jgi:hypothetical protein
MPRIRWTDLPPSLRQHLFDRVADRLISAEDLYKRPIEFSIVWICLLFRSRRASTAQA